MLALKSIRSFVRRQTRMTKAQKKAMLDLYPKYQIPQSLLDIHEIFGNLNPCWLEVGVGNGEAILEFASLYPDVNFIALDVYEPGIGTLVQSIEKRQLSNIKVLLEDVEVFFETHNLKAVIDRINIFFPDPWPKKRHQKRRLIKQAFINQLIQALIARGIIHFVTDLEDYAKEVDQLLSTTPSLEVIQHAIANLLKHERPETKYERRAKMKGHVIHELLYWKTEDSSGKK